MAIVVEELVYVFKTEADSSEVEGLGDAMEDTEEASDSLGSRLGKLAVGLAALAAAAAATAGKFAKDLVFGLAETQDEIAKTARTFGFSTDELQRLRFTAEASGVSFRTLQSTAKDLQFRLGEASRGGAQPFVDALADIGLQADDLKGKGLEEQFGLISDRLNMLPDQAERASIATQLFGGQAQKLNNVLQLGSKGISELGENAEKYGAVIDEEALAASEDFQDRLAETTATVKAIGIELGNKLIPIVRDIIVRFRDWATQNRALIASKIQGFVEGLVEIVVKLSEVVSVLADNWQILAGFLTSRAILSALPAIASGFSAMGVGATAALGPIGALAAAMAALIPIAIEAGNKVGDVLTGGSGPKGTKGAPAFLGDLTESERAAKSRIEKEIAREQGLIDADSSRISVSNARGRKAKLEKELEGLNKRGLERQKERQLLRKQEEDERAAADAEADKIIAEFEAAERKKEFDDQVKAARRSAGRGRGPKAAAPKADEGPTALELVNQAAGGAGFSSLEGRGRSAGLGGVFVNMDNSFTVSVGGITIDLDGVGLGGSPGEVGTSIAEAVRDALEPQFRGAYEHYLETVKP